MKRLSIAMIACLLVACVIAAALGEPAGGAVPADDAAIVEDFIENFQLLAAIPRQSKHEKAVSDALKGWAESLGYAVRQNGANDLFFDVPATEGCESLSLIDAADRAALEQAVAEAEAALREAFAGVEDGLTLTVDDAEPAGQVIDAEQANRVLAYVTDSINGVYTMSEVIDGLVESSSNLGQIQASADGIEIRQMPRSSSPERLEEIEAQFRALASENGFAIDIVEGSRPWPAKADSQLVPVVQRIYREQNGEEIKVGGDPRRPGVRRVL